MRRNLALFIAVDENNIEKVREIIDLGVNINAVDSRYDENILLNGSTALQRASVRGFDNIVSFLLSKGASIDKKNKKGLTD